MTEPTGTEAPEPSGDPSPPRAWLTRNLLVLSAVSFLQDTASELLYPILPIFITVVLGAPAAVLGSIEGLADGISAIVSPFAGRAADRMGRKPLIAARLRPGRSRQAPHCAGHRVAHRPRRPVCRPIRQGPARVAPRRAHRRRCCPGPAGQGVRFPPGDGHVRAR